MEEEGLAGLLIHHLINIPEQQPMRRKEPFQLGSKDGWIHLSLDEAELNSKEPEAGAAHLVGAKKQRVIGRGKIKSTFFKDIPTQTHLLH